MFLLIQIPDRDPDLTASPLHSTMFLLIQTDRRDGFILRMTLHSTMFLLIRLGRSHIPNSFVSFTFHYVSINTAALGDGLMMSKDLYIQLCFY